MNGPAQIIARQMMVGTTARLVNGRFGPIPWGDGQEPRNFVNGIRRHAERRVRRLAPARGRGSGISTESTYGHREARLTASEDEPRPRSSHRPGGRTMFTDLAVGFFAPSDHRRAPGKYCARPRVPGTGPCLPLERSQEVTQRLVAFMEQPRSAGGPSPATRPGRARRHGPVACR